MAPRKIGLSLVFALLAGATGLAFAIHDEAACGLSFREAPLSDREFIEIGNRFLVRNVRIAPHAQGVVVAGEIHNDRQGFFTFALFRVQLFNADCTVLGANHLAVHDFQHGITRPFRVIVPHVQHAEVASYHIEFLP